jgi:hypothetical protein
VGRNNCAETKFRLVSSDSAMYVANTASRNSSLHLLLTYCKLLTMLILLLFCRLFTILLLMALFVNVNWTLVTSLLSSVLETKMRGCNDENK